MKFELPIKNTVIIVVLFLLPFFPSFLLATPIDDINDFDPFCLKLLDPDFAYNLNTREKTVSISFAKLLAESFTDSSIIENHIPNNELIDLHELPELENSKYWMWKANYKGQPVLLRFGTMISPPFLMENEAKWSAALSSQGILSQKFFGFTKHQGVLGAVYSFVPGTHVGESYIKGDLKFDNLEAKNQALFQINNTLNFLKNNGVRFAFDVQFRITSSGQAGIIDLEFFKMAPSKKGVMDTDYRKLKNKFEKIIDDIWNGKPVRLVT